ncbi:MAG: 2-dehydropantoate 2-reductase [Sulfurimonas sp.]|uniref:ketopantoate reductase family protein n=1 Tax=Sulfurimonas sp. TaxID=2022749 RepID=UPI0028CD65D8|nr:2-dehydropantoate 2-reductase [Sulfurimonas sp.]MDT8338033.1 2-dehydropantoate 2-reductase [Sulfurimonas sp.]
MNICFYGVGGVGGYYGTLLTKYFNETGKGNTCFIARGKHKDAILEQGLLLKKEGGNEEILIKPNFCADTVNDLPVFDIVVVSVKGYDLESVTKEVSKITDENSIILPLLNGADIYDRMRQHLKKGYILPACLYLGTHIESPGVIFQKGGSCQISIGKDPSYPKFYPEKLLNLFKKADVLIEYFEDVNIEIWTKFIFIASFALVTATYDKTIGEVANDESLGILVKNIMQEIELIAKAIEIELPPDIVETSFSKANQFPFETKTSFQRDVELKGKQSEWDLFGGTVLRYADKFNIPANNTKETLGKLLQNLS